MPYIMDAETDPDYTNSHRAFLQAFLTHGNLTLTQARPILAACITAHEAQTTRETLPNDITEAELTNYITTINAHISPFDLEFRSTFSQHDRTRVYALVNTTSDSLTQLATVHGADEIAFVKRVLDEMFIGGCTRRVESFAVEGMRALNCKSVRNRQSGGNGDTTITQAQAQTISMHQAEEVLDAMVAGGWFECSGNRATKWYSLAPRALMELRGWLIETYNEEEEEEEQPRQRIKFCAACRDIVTIGQRCPDLGCLGRLHDHCTRSMWRSQNGAEKCPLCKRDWEGHGFVGERAVNLNGNVNKRRSTNGVAAGPSRRMTGPQMMDGAADEEDEEGSDDG
ncbi:Nse1 non-SMC component of SMC5-6 complex-domain-containing protein [Delphinella strobiligena]|nr:Nse1 non-SMC component of SMC5-6 complex-domain-containing protein [Delphinella strobiligena]